MWETHQSTGEESTLDKLPVSLSLEVQLYLNRGILTKVPFLRDADEIFIREIITKLRQHPFLPGDFIMRKGEYGDCMYFINSGHVSVLVNDDKTVVAVLVAGNHVGEMSLISGGPRNASVRAEDYCEVYELSKDRFDELRAKYPKFDAQVKVEVAKREAANKRKDE
ncbi:MAG: cyclic nucleotide-binding domain-containing protein [Verrucomicrobia bacterium]|nr:cyclic nucleotide-binding domain-containing protein [Verrucomicrobiota bacterium]